MNLYNTFSIMAHQVSIEHSVQAESKETLQHLLVDFVIRLITQFTKQITQSLEKSIRNVGGVRESITTGSLEGLLRLFYGLIQSVFFEKTSSTEDLILFRTGFCNASVRQWIGSVYPAPEAFLRNNESYQLFLNRYAKWLALVEEESKTLLTG